MKITNAFLFLLLAILSGCTTFHAKPLSPSRTAAVLESRTLASPGLRTFIESTFHREVTPWPPRSWDLTLLTLAAFYYHPELDVARAQWQVKEAEVITAGGRPNPSAGFTPQYHADPRGLSPWTLMFALDIPVETAWKRGYRIAKAVRLSTAARMKIAEAAWQVRSRLREALLSLYHAVETRRLSAQQEEIRREILALLQRRSDLGEDSVLAVTRADIALQRTRLALLEAEKEVARLRAAVATAIGLRAEALGGTALAQSKAATDLLVHAVLAGAGIVLLLSVVLNYRNLLLVLLNLPFALAGGVVVVLLSGGRLSTGSLVGFVTLFGITLRNSIMLISHYEHLVAVEGSPWGLETALRGATERLAPILMTATVTALGLLPLALASGTAGREIEGPMAQVILGGLLTSTSLNLLVLPALALRYGRFGKKDVEI